MTAIELKLDYFKLYNMRNLPAIGRVSLRGQFDNAAQRFELAVLDYLATPASKNEEPCFDRNTHLVWYRGLSGTVEPTRKVKIENQFGRSNLTLLGAAGLLVPTAVIRKGAVFSEALDHYKVYKVTDADAPGCAVKLRDEFGRESVVLGRPVFFAVPVEKTHGNRRIRVRNERAHLVLYSIAPRTVQRTISVRNQFAKSTKLSVVRSEMLAAPSVKRDWKVC